MKARKEAVVSAALGLGAAGAFLVLTERPSPSLTIAVEVGCLHAGDYGATVGDATDDRAALQTAIDAAVAGPGCLDLGPGLYQVTRRPEVGPAGIPSLVIRGPMLLRGPAILAMQGSAVRPGETAPADWVLLEIRADDVTISGIDFSGVGRLSDHEQNHLLQIRGPSSRVVVERSTFDHPGPLEGGDCIRLLGDVGARVRDVTIRDIHAPACYRSFLGIQRGVHGLLVERVVTEWVGDQAIDSEPTGGPAFACAPIVSDVTIRHSVLRRGVPHGIAITVAGDGCALMERVLIEDVVMPDGGVDIIDVGTVTLRGLVLDSAAAGDAQPTVLARRRVHELIIEDSIIRRTPHTKPHPVIQISALSGIAPSWAWLDGVTIEQGDPRAAVRVEGLGSLTIRGSTLRYTGAGPGDWAVSGSAGRRTMALVSLEGAWRGEAPL